MRIPFLFFCFFFSLHLLAQSNLDQFSIKELDSLATGHFQRGTPDAAIPLVKKIIEKAQAQKNELLEVEWSSNLALLYNMLGQNEAAEPLFLAAIKKGKTVFGEEHAKYISSLSNLALMYHEMGRFEEARKLYLEVQVKYKKLYGEKHPAYAVALNNIAGLWIDMRQPEKAEPLLLEALALRKNTLGEFNREYAISVSNMGGFYLNSGHLKKAKIWFEKALVIREKTLGKQSGDYLNTLAQLASLEASLGNLEKAAEEYTTCQKLFLDLVGPKHPTYIRNLCYQGDLQREMGNFEKAKQYLHQALLLNCNKTVDSLTFCTTFEQLEQYDYVNNTFFTRTLEALYQTTFEQAQVSGKKADLEYAYTVLDAFMRFSEKIRNGLGEEQDKLRVLNGVGKMVANAIDIGIRLDEGNSPQYLNNSFSFAEQNKSILLADALKGQKAQMLSDLPDSLIQREMQLKQGKKELERMQLEAIDEASKTQINAQLNGLNMAIAAFVQEIKEKFPKYHALKYKNIIAKVEEVQKALDEKSLMLEYFMTDSMTYLFAISKDKLSLHQLPIDKKRLALDIKGLRRALSDYVFIAQNPEKVYDLFTQKASMFYKLLLKEALEEYQAEQLIIITDGELGHLPFEVFLVESSNQKETPYADLHYLLKDYKISYNYSATLFLDALHSNKKQNNHQLLACAAEYANIDSLSLHQLRDKKTAKLRATLAPLPAVLEEVQGLEKQFTGRFLSGQASNETDFKARASNYGVIHLAMHGILNPKNPMLSSLAFTENGDSLNDNFLQAYEIAHMDIQADLVVLSACETGYGKFQQGEGILSLARSFMYAGTPSLVVSLWQVNDQSTAIIMKQFYQYLSEGQSKDAALRQAKFDYIDLASGIAQHPAFWSAFIQLGDSTPIELEHKNDSLLPYGLAAGGLLLIFFLFMRRKKI